MRPRMSPTAKSARGAQAGAAKRVAAPVTPKERVEVAVDPALLAEYAGRYDFAPGVVMDCGVEAGHLACQLTGQPRVPVYAESPSVFFYKVVDATLTAAEVRTSQKWLGWW